MNHCLNCNAETKNAKYCSRSCAATINNTISKKRKQVLKNCKRCGVDITSPWGTLEYRRTLCEDCFNNIKVNPEETTLASLQNLRKYQKASRVRNLARNLYKKSNKPKHCIICKYDKHYEVCHIKAISSYTGESALAEINNLDNLIALCPTHHWELDNGLLKLPK